MDYLGEHLGPGELGHFFIIFSLISSLAASVCYFLSVQKQRSTNTHWTGALNSESLQWRAMARVFFIAEAVSVFAIFGILYYIISSHLFEYKYAWQHSSRSLETKYLLSCFWEGQEGSFLLWSIWHCVLGLIIIKKERQFEGPVMAVLSFAQFCLATMIAGIAFSTTVKLGSNPFVLLRNELAAPIFSRPDYLNLVTDGNDLNPLLQNYWMVIHPPVLFLGFASTVVPFAFAMAGLWTRNFKDWIKPALPWALFSAAILGLGIMMGARWAYESLNFGGYWAWDPVENASLVPWLVLVAGIHTLLIYRHTGRSLKATFVFFILSFLLVLYSTYLTRSGDLQDTSVHAFTDLGMNWQLRLFLFLFVIPSFILFFKRSKGIPAIAKEEESSSREFWMFIGSLVLFLAAVTIIIMTSIPVFNKLVEWISGKQDTIKKIAQGEDAMFAYNRIQVFVAVILGILTAFVQYLKYKNTTKQYVWQRLLWPTIIAIAAGSLIIALGNISYMDHGAGFLGAVWLAVVAAVYTVIANASYIWLGVNGKLRLSGGAITHVGFGLMLTGILISSSKKELLSYNTSGIAVNFGEESKEKAGENLTLVKGVPTRMGEYTVTYEKDSVHPKKPLWFYSLHFKDKEGRDAFTLKPNAFVNYKGNAGLMANPDAQHYWNYDVFAYITSLPDPSKNKDTASFQSHQLKVGDTVFYSRGFAVLQDVVSRDHIPQAGFDPSDSATVATIKIFAKTNSLYTIQPLLINKGANGSYSKPDTVMAENLIVQLNKVHGNQVELGIKESNSVLQYITLKAYKFPFINLLWLGTLIMVIGFFVSAARRVQMNRSQAKL
jgi:cytochrome c-type biogenesis protein CcmF